MADWVGGLVLMEERILSDAVHSHMPYFSKARDVRKLSQTVKYFIQLFKSRYFSWLVGYKIW